MERIAELITEGKKSIQEEIKVSGSSDRLKNVLEILGSIEETCKSTLQTPSVESVNSSTLFTEMIKKRRSSVGRSFGEKVSASQAAKKTVIPPLNLNMLGHYLSPRDISVRRLQASSARATSREQSARTNNSDTASPHHLVRTDGFSMTPHGAKTTRLHRTKILQLWPSWDRELGRVCVMGGGSCLVTGMAMADAGFTVTFTDYSVERIGNMNEGKWWEVEEFLSSNSLAAYSRHVRILHDNGELAGDIYASCEPSTVIKYCDIILIELVWPFDEYTTDNLEDLAESLSPGQILILECSKEDEKVATSDFLKRLKALNIPSNIFICSVSVEDPFVKNNSFVAGNGWMDNDASWCNSDTALLACGLVKTVVAKKGDSLTGLSLGSNPDMIDSSLKLGKSIYNRVL